MKTVSGSIFSKKGVSLSKAARILSKFAFAENGASPAFAAYLKRASVSFDELVQFHREINGPASEHKDRKNKHPSSSGVVNDETLIFVKRPSKDNDFVTQEKQFSSGLKKLGNGDVKEDSEIGERKKQNQGGERKGEDKDESQVVNDNISRKRKHKRDVPDGGLDNSEEQEQSKKRKK